VEPDRRSSSSVQSLHGDVPLVRATGWVQNESEPKLALREPHAPQKRSWAVEEGRARADSRVGDQNDFGIVVEPVGRVALPGRLNLVETPLGYCPLVGLFAVRYRGSCLDQEAFALQPFDRAPDRAGFPTPTASRHRCHDLRLRCGPIRACLAYPTPGKNIECMRSVRPHHHNDRMNQLIAEASLTGSGLVPNGRRPNAVSIQHRLRDIARHTAYIDRGIRNDVNPVAIHLIDVERDRLIERAGLDSRIDDGGNRWLLMDGFEIAYLGCVRDRHVQRERRARPRLAATGWRKRLSSRFRSTTSSRSNLSESHR
jgi:hypothetical protein